jgi:hypothetical protein
VTAALPDDSGEFDDDVASVRLDGQGYPGATSCREGGVTRVDVREATPDLYVGGFMVCAARLARGAAEMLSGTSGVETADPE